MINLNKLGGIPKIYYLNCDHMEDRKKYMENQFEIYGIDNYERISKNLYTEKNYEQWKKLILDEKIFLSKKNLGTTILNLKTIIDWYDNDNSEYCIIMEDNINLSLCEKWIFDWQTLMDNLPYNWDCIQLYTSPSKVIKMHLSPKEEDCKSTSCYMITRHFAKKIKLLHYCNKQFKLYINEKNDKIPYFEYGSFNYFLYELGITYTIPLFNLNSKFIDDNMEDDDNLYDLLLQKLASESIEYWWSVKSMKCSTYEFFNFNKRYDWKMEVQYDKGEVWKDADHTKLLLWI